VYKLYKVEIEDLSEYRGSYCTWEYGETAAEAIKTALDNLDLSIKVTPGTKVTPGDDFKPPRRVKCTCTYHNCGCDNPAPLTKLRRVL
jgi:hypothetical protein